MNFDTAEDWTAACHTLMRIAGREDLWLPSGPTGEALRLREEDGGPLSPSERVMLLATFSFWDGDETLRFRELSRLQPESLFAVATLAAALAVDQMQLPEAQGTRCVDTWLAEEAWLIR